MSLYEYLQNTYPPNTPIILSDLQIEGMSDVNLRQQIKKLTDTGLLKRYDTGIYFIPGKSIFRSGTQLSCDQVIEKKYLRENDEPCGYISGLLFANQMGLTTQVPMIYDVVTNKATTERRETMLAKNKVILHKPKVPVNKANVSALQFLDLIRDVDAYAEVSDQDIQAKIREYMMRNGIDITKIEPYLQFYPDKVYRNLYKAGVLYGISAQ